MEESGGVKTKAAQLLGYRNYQTLAAQLDRLKVDVLENDEKRIGTAVALMSWPPPCV